MKRFSQTIGAVIFFTISSFSGLAQNAEGTITPGSIRIDTTRSQNCGQTGYYFFVKYRLPTFTSSEQNAVPVPGAVKIKLLIYQNNTLRKTYDNYPLTNFYYSDSLMIPNYDERDREVDRTLSGFDYVLEASFFLNGTLISTQTLGEPGSGVDPGVNNDRYFFCNPTYYSKASGDLSLLSSWSLNNTNSGLMPPDFGSRNTFLLSNRGLKYTMTAPWTVQGKLLVPANSVLDLNGFPLTIDTIGLSGGTASISGNAFSNLTIDHQGSPAVQGLNFTPGSNDFGGLFLQTPPGSMVYLMSPVNIYSQLIVPPGTSFQTSVAENLVLKSGPGRTGRIIIFPEWKPGDFTSLGPLTVERYIPARRAWRLLGAPLSTNSSSINESWQEGTTNYSANPNPFPGYGTHITEGSASAGFDHNPLTAMTSIKKYNSAANAWIPLSNTSITEKVGGSAYFVFIRGDRSINLSSSDVPATSTVLRSRGYANVGDQTFQVAKDGFTAIPNPFAMAIDFRTVTRTNVPNSFYVWDPKLGGENGVGGYVLVSFNGSGYDETPAAVSQLGQYIESGQAFLVASNPRTSGSITIKESDKSYVPTRDAFRVATDSGVTKLSSDTGAQSTKPGLRISLQSVENEVSLLDEVFSSYGTNFSDKIDAFDGEKLANIEENVAIIKDGHNLMVERSASLDKEDIIILKTWNLRPEKQYQFEFNPLNLGVKISTAYLVDSYLHTVTPVKLNGISHVQFRAPADNVSLSNRFSVLFKEASGDIAGKSGFSVFPNPVAKKTVQLSFSDQPQGKYTVQLINSLGQTIYSTYLTHQGGAAIHILQLNKRPAPGIYTLQVKSRNTKRSTEVLFK